MGVYLSEPETKKSIS